MTRKFFLFFYLPQKRQRKQRLSPTCKDRIFLEGVQGGGAWMSRKMRKKRTRVCGLLKRRGWENMCLGLDASDFVLYLPVQIDEMFGNMSRDISQEEIREIIISDMVKKRDSIVPVIGEDTIVYQETGTGKEIPFQEFIFNEFQKKYPRVEVDDATLTSMKERGYYGLSLLSQYYNEQGRFLDDFMDFVSRNASCIKLKGEVFDFLVTFNFPIILTTVCFDIIEKQLKGKIESYNSIWYRLNKENSTLPSRCVYHIFGQAKDGSKWVSDEDLLLTFLLSHNHKEYGATGLTDFLKENEKKLFVLGCNLPNWLFRFLWQPTQTGRNTNMKTKQGYWINKEKPEDSFENFLTKKNFFADEQVKEILVDATKLMQEELKREEKEHNSMIDAEEHFDVFISYASEDRQIASDIFEKLKDLHIIAWFDDRGKGEIAPGDPYWEKIRNGIKHSAHFMSIITGNWREKLTSTSSLKEETYYANNWMKESKMSDGIQLKKNYSIPVIVKGSSHNGVTITDSNIEIIARAGVIPQYLYDGINMITFDGENYSEFEKIEW